MQVTPYQHEYLRLLLARKQNPEKVGRFRWMYRPVFALSLVAVGGLGAHSLLWMSLFLAGVVTGGLFGVASVSRHTHRRWPIQDALCDWDDAKRLADESCGVQPSNGSGRGDAK